MTPPKKKRVNKTKAQIAAEQQQHHQWEREKDIARTLIFPVLEKHTRSVAHAEQVCEVVNSVIRSKMNMHWEEKTVGDLGLIEELSKDKDSAQPEMYEEILTNIKDVSIFEAVRVMEILGKVVGAYATDLARKKTLSEVPVEDIIK